VTNARASASQIKVTPELVNDPVAFKKFQDAQAQLSGALSRLLVTVEQYPNLKSDQNFLALQSQLEGTENRIAVERRKYNETVRDFNSQVRVFPASMVASFRGFKDKPFFEAQAGADQAPKVKF
jgi:LemA protein